jgi:hypothetical protein
VKESNPQIKIAVNVLYKTLWLTQSSRRRTTIPDSELNKNTSAAKWDEGSRGTTQIQKDYCPFLMLLNAEYAAFLRRLGVSTHPAPESSHQPLSL